MVFEWEETFLSIWLFPWSLGRSIIALRLQTEMAQTHRHPANQNGSCGSGTHRPLISLGLGLVWCEQTKGITPAHLCSCQVVCQNGKRFFKEKLQRKAVGCFLPTRSSVWPRSSPQSLSSCGFSELRRRFLCRFFISSTCHLAGSAIVPCPFSPCSFCRDKSCHPLVISTFVAFVFGPTSEVHLVFYVPAFHA